MTTLATCAMKKEYVAIRTRIGLACQQHHSNCGGNKQNQVIKRFSVDPALTTLSLLRELLTIAYNLQCDFIIKYSTAVSGTEKYIPIMNDWDLTTALYDSSDPVLDLKIDCLSNADDWDVVDKCELSSNCSECDAESTSNLSTWSAVSSGNLSQYSTNSTNSISNSNSNDRTLTASVGRLLRNAWFRSSFSDNGHSSSTSLPSDPWSDWSQFAKTRTPLTREKFNKFLDPEGRLIRYSAFRLAVFQGGVDSSLRPLVWQYLLRVYHPSMTEREREKTADLCSAKYMSMRNSVVRMFRDDEITDELRLVAGAVRKDVVRTDRTLPFFSGDEDSNENLKSLFFILTTYALAHPTVSYCQGMSDLAAPILYVMRNEAAAYACFCGLMRRMKRYFSFDSSFMRRKFEDMEELLQRYDPQFLDYLRQKHTDYLLFCYRWFLLELKREFRFDDSLLIMEVMWASTPLPPDWTNPDHPFRLCEVDLAERSRLVTPVASSRLSSVDLESSAAMAEKTIVDSGHHDEEEQPVTTTIDHDDLLNDQTVLTPLNAKRRFERVYPAYKRLKSDCSQMAQSCPDDVLTAAIRKYQADMVMLRFLNNRNSNDKNGSNSPKSYPQCKFLKDQQHKKQQQKLEEFSNGLAVTSSETPKAPVTIEDRQSLSEDDNTTIINDGSLKEESPPFNESLILNESPRFNESPVLNESTIFNESPRFDESPLPRFNESLSFNNEESPPLHSKSLRLPNERIRNGQIKQHSTNPRLSKSMNNNHLMEKYYRNNPSGNSHINNSITNYHYHYQQNFSTAAQQQHLRVVSQPVCRKPWKNFRGVFNVNNEEEKESTNLPSREPQALVHLNSVLNDGASSINDSYPAIQHPIIIHPTEPDKNGDDSLTFAHDSSNDDSLKSDTLTNDSSCCDSSSGDSSKSESSNGGDSSKCCCSDKNEYVHSSKNGLTKFLLPSPDIKYDHGYDKIKETDKNDCETDNKKQQIVTPAVVKRNGIVAKQVLYLAIDFSHLDTSLVQWLYNLWWSSLVNSKNGSTTTTFNGYVSNGLIKNCATKMYLLNGHHHRKTSSDNIVSKKKSLAKNGQYQTLTLCGKISKTVVQAYLKAYGISLPKIYSENCPSIPTEDFNQPDNGKVKLSITFDKNLGQCQLSFIGKNDILDHREVNDKKILAINNSDRSPPIVSSSEIATFGDKAPIKNEEKPASSKCTCDSCCHQNSSVEDVGRMYTTERTSLITPPLLSSDNDNDNSGAGGENDCSATTYSDNSFVIVNLNPAYNNEAEEYNDDHRIASNNCECVNEEKREIVDNNGQFTSSADHSQCRSSKSDSITSSVIRKSSNSNALNFLSTFFSNSSRKQSIAGSMNDEQQPYVVNGNGQLLTQTGKVEDEDNENETSAEYTVADEPETNEDGNESSAAETARKKRRHLRDQSPVPIAVDATVDNLEEFKDWLTLTQIHEMCLTSNESSRRISQSGSPKNYRLLKTMFISDTSVTTANNNEDYWGYEEERRGSSVSDYTPSSPFNEEATDHFDTTTAGAGLVSSNDPFRPLVTSSNGHLQQQEAVSGGGGGGHFKHLPGPDTFGDGNPFMLFICLVILTKHRDEILKQNLDYNEICLHFDKMMRKHNVKKVLKKARQLYADYLKSFYNNSSNNNNDRFRC